MMTRSEEKLPEVTDAAISPEIDPVMKAQIEEILADFKRKTSIIVERAQAGMLALEKEHESQASKNAVELVSEEILGEWMQQFTLAESTADINQDSHLTTSTSSSSICDNEEDEIILTQSQQLNNRELSDKSLAA